MNEVRAYVGIDWAIGTPAALWDCETKRQQVCRLEQTPAALQEWAMSLRARFGGEIRSNRDRTIARGSVRCVDRI